MGRNPNSKPVQILYIGRADPMHEKVWQGFQQEGIAVAFARTQVAGLQLARELQPSLIVINTANSHFSGESLCKTLARRLPQARRLVIVGRGEGAHMEAEERLAPPFTARKLRETIRKLAETASPHVLAVGPIELDLITRLVTSRLGRVHVTPKQCRLLAIFMQRPNQVISRSDLMKEIWDTHYLGDTRTLDVHIRWLREKIEEDPTHPRILVTQRGIGYKLIAAGQGPVQSLDGEEEAESEVEPEMEPGS
jgi:DNA-binding response OmpR family regulator